MSFFVKKTYIKSSYIIIFRLIGVIREGLNPVKS